MVSDGNTILFVIILYAWHLQACSKKGILSIERGLSQSGQTQAHTTVQHCNLVNRGTTYIYPVNTVNKSRVSLLS